MTYQTFAGPPQEGLSPPGGQCSGNAANVGAFINRPSAFACTHEATRPEHQHQHQQHELVTLELNMTSQRVNLFEKVKIPACKENIRIIKIALGDLQTASVTRGKIAKSRSKKEGSDEEDAA